MISSPISKSHQIFAEQESISCCQKVTIGEVLSLIASVANGALIGAVICFAFSNPAGWVATATIISGALAGALICTIAIFAYRHFSSSGSDSTYQNAVHTEIENNKRHDQGSDLSEIDDAANPNVSTESYTSLEIYPASGSQSGSEDTDSQPCLSGKSNSQEINLEDENIDVMVEPFSELQKNLMLNLLDTLNAEYINRGAEISSLKFLNSYGVNKNEMKYYMNWIYIWESDSFSRYPHLLNSMLTIDIKKMNENIVKGFTYDERPFIAFKINSEMAIIFNDTLSEEQKSSKPLVCIFYNNSSSKNKIEYCAEVVDETGELTWSLSLKQLKSLIQHGKIMNSSECSLSSKESGSYSSETGSYSSESESYSDNAESNSSGS